MIIECLHPEILQTKIGIEIFSLNVHSKLMNKLTGVFWTSDGPLNCRSLAAC